MKIDFSRSNVNDSMLNITSPRKSTFDLYHKHHHSLPIGRFVPVNVQSLMPDSVLSGTIKPEYTLEQVVTPQVGPLRFDTHTIAVSARRINRDWRKLIEDSSDVQNVPSFHTSVLPSGFWSRFYSEIFNPFAYLLDRSFVDEVQLTVDLSAATLDICSRYRNDLLGSFWDRGYLRDWALSEIGRLENSVYLFDSSFESAQFAEVSDWAHFVMQPLFGEGSLLDELGYPCYCYYSPVWSVARSVFDIATVSDPLAAFNVFSNCGSDFWLISSVELTPSVGAGFALVFGSDVLVNEMPIRAAYAAWYDALRNWHVEERKNVVDPDDWDKTPIFYGAEVWEFSSLPYQLLLPRYRCFGSDPFTTIQTDDVFRHVFAPIMPDNGEINSNSYTASNGDDDNYDNIYQVMIAGISKVFPQGLFRRSAESSLAQNQYLLDLQTMKRTGMLERYLARNYYFPDTYEGQMRARYNIDASDLLGCTSRYISGSESFLTGEQQISNVSTSEMEAGTRVMTGGSSATEAIQFASQGDFIYLVTFASIIPIPDYDALDPHLVENSRADLPFPEFADDTRVQINNSDIIRNLGKGSLIGYVPRYYQYRCQLDSVHGKYLREYRSYLWLRDWYSTYGAALINELHSIYYSNTNVSPFTIDAYGLHVHVPLDAFLGTVHEFDPIAYGKLEFNFAVNCPLPAAVETV